MQHSAVVILSGSPSPSSRTAMVAEYVRDELARAGIGSTHLRLRELPPEPLLRANAADPAIKSAVDLINTSRGLVIATPTYKAAYSGLLKVFLDLLPQYGLGGKAVMPIASGGSLAHVLALDYALRPVLHSMAARHVVQSTFMLEKYLDIIDGRLEIDDIAKDLLQDAILAFRAALPTAAVAA